MTKFWSTVAFRLALSYGLLAIVSMSVLGSVLFRHCRRAGAEYRRKTALQLE
jgi:hypothetical protein